MAYPSGAWGIEIGQYAIKALRLERTGNNEVVVTDFAVVPHRKVLSTPDIDISEVTRLSLGQFISEKNLEGEHLVISVPGHSAFARFAKLPPVEPKALPEIVKFEAVQQIPFAIEDVEWDYEAFREEFSREDDKFLLVYKCGNPLSRENITRLESVTDDLEWIDGIENIISLTRAAK